MFRAASFIVTGLAIGNNDPLPKRKAGKSQDRQQANK